MRSRRSRLFLGTLHLALTVALFSCSDDEPPMASGGSIGAGGKATAGSSAGGNAAAGAGGGTSSGGTAATGNTSSGNTGNIPVDACPGLPFDNTGSGGEPGADGGAPAGGAPAGGAPAGGAPAGGAPSSDGGAPASSGGAPGEACLGVSAEAERINVDMFIMMDSSQSMGFPIEGTDMTRWDALRDAVQEFAGSPEAGDIGAGIGFFSLSGAGIDDLDCNPADYAEPVVGIGPLSETGPDLVAAIEDKVPAGLTPTLPALQGAIDYAKSWAEDHPDRATVVVLVSDGFPTQCGGGPEDVAGAAEAGYDGAPHIRTYVIGVGDVARFNLDNYARSGGTEEAFLTEDNSNASASFVDALLNITASEIACEFEIPEPPDMMQVDKDKVRVVYTPQGGDSEEVPKVVTLGDCADAENGGWFYDNESAPTRIYVCPCTCARFGAGRVDVELGCEPRLGLH